MKILKKITVVILTVLMLIGGAVISVSAAPAAPTFRLEVVSETNTSVTLRLSLESGTFNSFDVAFSGSNVLGDCKEIKTTTEFGLLCLANSNEGAAYTSAFNIKTAKFSVASTKGISEPISVCDVVFAKKSSVKVSEDDYGLSFSSCVISVGETNYNVTSSTKIVKGAAYFITFETETLTGNYKDKKTIEYSTNLAQENIKWSSSNTKVATVDNSGKVTLTGTGSATIKAESADGTVCAECKVTSSYSTLQWIIIIVLFGWIWY